MSEVGRSRMLSQLHIDAARNSTDDFNPFHDPHKWRRIDANPFGGPIALGFQLETLAVHRVEWHHRQNGEDARARTAGLGFGNFDYGFADVIRPGEAFELVVRPTNDRIRERGELSNRVTIRSGRRLVMLGHQRETAVPLVHGEADFTHLGDLSRAPDRSLVGEGLFLKRKFMNTSNAKNFLLGSLVDQYHYFDELEDRVCFPTLFPVALISCALLEKALAGGYDFYRRPMVYTAHQVTVDRALQAQLKSNDRLHILVRGPEPVPGRKGLGKSDIPQQMHHCFGLVEGNRILFRARVAMALLQDVVQACGARTERRAVTA
ncbi:MAG TPA: hypothetical protein ENI96_11540 [Sedimenticola thiotaurini]|uniref:MaoC-like domain-containing protein n=1 Tax=Sedimenticola thiotaurini TaxID=1543721 RepID=A0A831RQC3_9GAMM|nr:hypothetical protein [Sedimenticola thiotaurini]